MSEDGKKEQSIAERIEALKNDIVDAAGDAAEAALQKLDEVLEITQTKIRELKTEIDDKTEPKE